jgi:hypothetical protein
MESAIRVEAQGTIFAVDDARPVTKRIATFNLAPKVTDDCLEVSCGAKPTEWKP